MNWKELLGPLLCWARRALLRGVDRGGEDLVIACMRKQGKALSVAITHGSRGGKLVAWTRRHALPQNGVIRNWNSPCIYLHGIKGCLQRPAMVHKAQ
jgi:hypothetical protein